MRAAKTKKPKRVVKRWQFAWCDADSPPTPAGDAHTWRSKTFRAATFERAMDKMLEFVRAKPFVCLVDYECAARHVPYSPTAHGATFHRIDKTRHDLAEYSDW